MNATVFVDANTLVYHFQPHPVLGSPCTALVKRIELKELSGVTSTHVVSEIAHRLMTMEASIAFGWTSKIVEMQIDQGPAAVRKDSDATISRPAERAGRRCRCGQSRGGGYTIAAQNGKLDRCSVNNPSER